MIQAFFKKKISQNSQQKKEYKGKKERKRKDEERKTEKKYVKDSEEIILENDRSEQREIGKDNKKSNQTRNKRLIRTVPKVTFFGF